MPSLTLAEARERARAVADVRYAIDLDLTGAGGSPDSPGAGSPTYGLRTTVTFTAHAPETFLELAAARDLEVTLDGVALPASSYDGHRLMLTGLGRGEHEVVVTARVPYVTDGDGMHRFTDPADGATYASAYVGMDVAQKVFCCFDQNDLKAPVTLHVTCDPTWTVLANGRAVSSDDGDWRFATTPPIPTAMFVVAAGPWHSHTWEHAGLPFGWHARASLAADLDRDIDELRATTEACFDFYTTRFEEPYAFDSYDQAFVPGQNWGALETPGCVTYRDEYLPRGLTTDGVRGDRASTIAHEMAHLWFGDLVTMTWWEDTWLQESFADYMGYRVSGEAAGRADAQARFETGRKPTGYEADRRRSTHPVAALADDVPDVDAAAGNFDMISYAKGNAALKQLAVWLGEDAFWRGLNTYLTRHRFSNTTLADFVAALDEASDRDVTGWVEAWLRTTGYDTLRVTRRDDGTPVLSREGVREHRVTVASFDETWREVDRSTVDVGADPVPLPDLAGRVVVPNAGGETFARLELDDESWTAVRSGLSRIADPTTRAVLWTAAVDLALTRDLPVDGDDGLVDLVARELPGEPLLATVSSVLARVRHRVLPMRATSEALPGLLDTLAQACRTGLAHAGDEGLARAFAVGVVECGHDVETLQAWLEADAIGPLPLSPSERWAVVRRLAELGALDADAVASELARDPSAEGGHGAARALAARPIVEAKEAAWAEASDPAVDNRRFTAVMSGLWALEQGALLTPYVDRYLAEAPGWATRGQAFGQTVGRSFPAVPLTDEQVTALERTLAPDARLTTGLTTVLRRSWDDRLDDLR